MDVELYIYDLSQGLARELSRPLTGIQIDAIYHTSLVFGGVEYFFGRGIQQAAPGTTHHGQPIEKLHMGKSELPQDVVVEYMQSLAGVYTEDSYDLFLRNCNNFTHDLAMFLVGKGIPDHIRNLPQEFLNTPFGQMMKPYIDGMLRGVTQAPSVGPPPLATGMAPGPDQPIPAAAQPSQNGPSEVKGRVHNATTLREVEGLLSTARSSCAVIFFTSSTCAPCKIVYPAYDELAEEAGDKATLIKVDLNSAFDVSSKYGVRATPTFMTFLKGEKENEWSGANESQLRGNVRLLIQMAWPLHPHRKLKLPSFEHPITSYITYRKLPPLDKLVQKIGPAGEDPALKSIVDFIKIKERGRPAEASLPDLRLLADFIQTKFTLLPREVHFAVIDLVRVAFIDPRVTGFFAEESLHKTLLTLLSQNNDLSGRPYNQQLVMTQLACNLFTSTIYPDRIASNDNLRETCISLATHALHDSHSNLRAAAVSLIYNIAAYNHNQRLDDKHDKLSEAAQVELVASLLEAIRAETESVDTLHGLLLSLGLFIYLAHADSEVIDLCKAMEAGTIVREKAGTKGFSGEPLLKEVGQELLGKGLASP